MSMDPVCGMDVKEEGAPTSDYQGKTYYFCCEGCKKSFDEDPKKYLNKEEHAHDHPGHHH